MPAKPREPKLDPQVAAAHARYRALSRTRQLQLLSELLETRAHELMRAYHGVTRIGLGWRRQRDHRGHGIVCWHETPCVLFMVKRKWRRGSNPSHAGRIPSHLLAYASTARGKRVLVAVPTDVDSSAWMNSARAEAGIHAFPSNGSLVNDGVVCTVLRRSDQPDKRYALSCRHVLSFGILASFPCDGVKDDTARIGDVTSIAGANSGPQPLDAQVFLVTDANASLPTHAKFATSEAGVRIPLRHHAPSLDDASSQVSYRGLWKPSLEANVDVESWMFAGELLEIDLPAARTQRGDSGSAVTSLDGRTLVGMHIGSAQSKQVDGFVSICVPAWRLMAAKSFQGMPGSVAWRLA
jgi:hypothetical protein